MVIKIKENKQKKKQREISMCFQIDYNMRTCSYTFLSLIVFFQVLPSPHPYSSLHSMLHPHCFSLQSEHSLFGEMNYVICLVP